MTIHRIAGEGRGPFFIPLYQFHPLTNIETFICNFACEMTITYFYKEVIRLWRPQRGGGQQILSNFADGCGWFLGRVYSSDPAVDVHFLWRMKIFFDRPVWQTDIYMKPTKVPPWLAPSGKIFKICASRSSKNTPRDLVCSKISL